MEERPNINTVRNAVADILQRYVESKGQLTLPEPMPQAVGPAVDWWIKTMMEPEVRHEHPLKGRNGGWSLYPYQQRVTDCLLRFLRLPMKDKQMIAAGREDGTYWRGESIKQFMQIVDETVRMREMGVDAYKAQAINGLRNFGKPKRKAA